MPDIGGQKPEVTTFKTELQVEAVIHKQTVTTSRTSHWPQEIVIDDVGDQNDDGHFDRVVRAYSILSSHTSLQSIEEGRTLYSEKQPDCSVDYIDNGQYFCGVDYVEYQRSDGTFSLADPNKQVVKKWDRRDQPVRANLLIWTSTGDRWVDGTNLHDGKYRKVNVRGLDQAIIEHPAIRAEDTYYGGNGVRDLSGTLFTDD